MPQATAQAERTASQTVKLADALRLISSLGEPAEFRAKMHPAIRNEILERALPVARWLTDLEAA